MLTRAIVAGLLTTLVVVTAKAQSGSSAGTLKVCDQSVPYTIEPSAADAPPGLRAFSGIWIGNLALACAAAIFERTSDPNAVAVTVIIGRWAAAGGAVGFNANAYRSTGVFARDRVTVSGSRFGTELILRSPTEIVFNSIGSMQTNSGVLKKQ